MLHVTLMNKWTFSRIEAIFCAGCRVSRVPIKDDEIRARGRTQTSPISGPETLASPRSLSISPPSSPGTSDTSLKLHFTLIYTMNSSGAEIAGKTGKQPRNKFCLNDQTNIACLMCFKRCVHLIFISYDLKFNYSQYTI